MSQLQPTRAFDALYGAFSVKRLLVRALSERRRLLERRLASQHPLSILQGIRFLSREKVSPKTGTTFQWNWRYRNEARLRAPRRRAGASPTIEGGAREGKV